MRICSVCVRARPETTVPDLLCGDCAREFYAGLLEHARFRRVICTGPTVQALEQTSHERQREIARLAQAINERPAWHRGSRVVYFVDFERRGQVYPRRGARPDMARRWQEYRRRQAS